MKEKQNDVLFDKETLTEYEKIFKIMERIPACFLIISCIIAFFGGLIVFGLTESKAGLLIMVLGCGINVLTYFLMRISISYMILHISYLKEIKDKLNETK